MIVKVEDIIAHTEFNQELSETADLEELLRLLGYKDNEPYHMVNGKHEPRDFRLSEGDTVSIILALGGG